jgi:hypothetical protein
MSNKVKEIVLSSIQFFALMSFSFHKAFTDLKISLDPSIISPIPIGLAKPKENFIITHPAIN